MANNMFTTLAKKATTLSPLMDGREKIDVDEIIKDYPNGITIMEFDMVTTSLDTFPVFVYSEDSTKFAFGGAILNNIIESWIEKFDGDIESASNALKAAGGVKMSFEKSKTKSGNNITLVNIL